MRTKKNSESSSGKLAFQNFAKVLFLITAMIIFASGCITMGKDFPETNVSSIKVGITSKNEIRRLFGSPWLSGIQDGQLAWTYGNYDYSLFGKRKAKDLVIQFDDNVIVSTFTFSTTEHNE